ncbi:cytochrome P450 monooxygenase-like protein [Lophiostoma macrostomum CBS 122681]|uniref:Cytochrome P450 monooxygenase-like protein n=1 Tax=Lophiostoma macrostomum CBS 122681 TaxID=1314788 RepID=A0A6A6TG97_9PLEO|nr:cytochrome P450 monooxygenase-like protein [Lophiostoma macrostomum CBS 122681]
MLTLLSPPLLSTIIPLLLLFLLLTITIKYLRNPLRKIPAAHPLAPLTPLWIHWIRWRSIENATLKSAHRRLGPVICLSPSEVSVNCVKGGVRDVYAGGFEKGAGGGEGGFNWYGFFTNFGGVDNMFSTACNKTHSTRKRMISNIYSKSIITSSSALLAQTSTILYDRFLPALASTFDQQEQPGVLNIYALLSGATMDIVTGYIFGLAASSNLISNPKQLDWFLGLYNSRRSYNFWPQELPGFTAALQKWFGYRLVPKWVDEANLEIEKWTKDMCDGAARVLTQSKVDVQDTPAVYQQLTSALVREAKKADSDRKEDLNGVIASEVLDHLAAGFDTSGITLTYVIHELSVHPEVQHRLQQELQSLSPQLTPEAAPGLPDPKAVDSLPLLHAVIWETLRLRSAIPGPQPRVTPCQGCRLGPEERDYYVPGGVRVSASAGLLHSNEEVYERAEEWMPDRWLEDVGEERKKDMESRWFWAFGSGGRMCVGSHLAVYQMKYIVAALYSNYTTIIIDDSGIEQSDAYTAPPTRDRLLIELHHVKTG